MKFTNKITIITGAANGIGEKAAKSFYERGSSIVVCDIQAEKLQENFSNLDSARVLIYPLDVSKSEAWEQLTKDVIKKFGCIDYLLNIAGVIEPAFVHETRIQDIDKQIDINLKGSIYGTHYVSQYMVEAKAGHIINISSMAGIAGVPGLNIYSATKFGVRGFSLSAAQELMEYGVHLSLICPDAVETDMLDYQKDKKEAALTFSGSSYLTVEDVNKTILKLIEKPKIEVWLPKSRGILSTISVIFPGLASRIKGSLIKKGLKKQAKY